MNVLIGTSGWSYKDWINVFYEDESSILNQYWNVFKTVEINSTFYRFPTFGFIRYLAKNTPPGFVYAAKIPNVITHKKKLDPEKNVKSDLKRFLDTMSQLKEHTLLGPLLIQMPPKPTSDFPNFTKFLESLPSDYMWAIEFRDLSWLESEIFDLLKENNVGYVIVDEPLLPPDIKITTNFAYIRWHGRSSKPWYYYRYSEKELLWWVPHVKNLSTKVDVVYGYFNNHFKGYAVQNALQFLKLLGIANNIQLEVLNRIDYYFKEESLKKVKRDAEKAETLDDLLLLFVNKSRLKRGKEISDSKVKIQVNDTLIYAKVKQYEIEIDLMQKKIKHNCADWVKQKEEKKMCKHIVKLFNSLSREQSFLILKDISTNIELWSFEQISE